MLRIYLVMQVWVWSMQAYRLGLAPLGRWLYRLYSRLHIAMDLRWGPLDLWRGLVASGYSEERAAELAPAIWRDLTTNEDGATMGEMDLRWYVTEEEG